MNIRTLLCGILLGFLTVVETTTIHTHVTKNQNADDDVLTEAVKDGYIVRQTPPPSPTSPTSMSPLLPVMMDLLSHESSGDSESGSGDFTQFETKKHTVETSLGSELEGSGSGAGSEIVSETRIRTGSEVGSEVGPETTSEVGPRTALETLNMKATSNGLLQGGGAKPADEDAQHKGHSSTPGWIIIVAFVVGVAALVLLCVAIATREKWNGPSHPKRIAPVQQRALEKHTLLNAKSPVENGKDEEYTVIPLEELPYKYSEV